MEKIVRSIDLGYGQTKLIKDITAKGIIKTATFPSMTVLANASNSLVVDSTNQHDVELVEHDTNIYKAGVDIHLLSNSYSNRVLNKDFIQSNDYHVLMKAALLMMKTEFIDVLVLGLPVNKLKSGAQYLQSTWRGEIKLNSKNKVQVNKVVVTPQPLGGFYKFASSFEDFQSIKSKSTLIIDVGFFTVDWLVIKDMKLAGANGSYEGGMSFLLSQIEEKIGKSINNPITQNKIDSYFYKNELVYLDGEKIDMKPFNSLINSTVDQSIQALKNFNKRYY